jgi:hypothetical protein
MQESLSASSPASYGSTGATSSASASFSALSIDYKS